MYIKLLAAIKKEALLQLRDKIGLAILFIMPVVLIIVMTLIQDAAFKTINEKGIPIVLVNGDKDSLGNAVYRGLKNSTLCDLKDSINGQPATAESVRKAVAKGTFIIGIIIPERATEIIRNNVEDMVHESMGLLDSAGQNVSKSQQFDIQLVIDPVAKKSFVSSVTSSLHEFISELKSQIMFRTFSDEIQALMPDGTKMPSNAYEKANMIRFKEEYASELIGASIPTAVQHNVPAWTIFGMFFIVISVVGNIMKEKKEGSAFRLQTMPTSYILLMNGKIMVHVIVCFLQFLIMLGVGIFILPFFGLPPLQLGPSIGALLFLAICTSFAATGFGVLVGTLASSEQQGAIMGSLSILLLSAIGGILVPTYVMPELMRNISIISPLNWSLDGFYKLFLRGAGWVDIIPNCIQLITFFLLMMSISSVVNRIKKNI
jgi:ABC-2 type transport system permease protein